MQPSLDGATVAARCAAVHEAYSGIWSDFLRNRQKQAEERAAAFLRIIESIPEAEKNAELWVAKADFLHICGAVQGNNSTLLEEALTAYWRSLEGAENFNARRMVAESLLRLHRYREAFDVLATLGLSRPLHWKELEVAPFRLRHDADLCLRLGRLGRLPAEVAVSAADGLKELAAKVDSRYPQNPAKHGRWPQAGELGGDEAELLERCMFDLLPMQEHVVSPLWPSQQDEHVLNNNIDWLKASEEYFANRIVVIDDFFSPEVLSELWRYTQETPHFRTLRKGYLGAFPADGNTHPYIMEAALSLERLMPQVFAGHPLGLWWFFKYPEAPTGINIHADQAAVNVNIWLTPDEARESGGGLHVYMQLPPDEGGIWEHNRERREEDEAHLRSTLIAAGDVRKVEYRQNRAVMFVSDLFHESELARFKNPSDQPRVNLTLLFGDRGAGRREASKRQASVDVNALKAEVQQKSEGDADWSLFDG